MPSKGGRWNCGLTQEGLRGKVLGEREGQIGNSRLSLALTPVLVYFSVRGFRGELYAPLARLHYWVLTLVALLVLTLEWHWNMLGFRF